jgi:hypothetical protein
MTKEDLIANLGTIARSGSKVSARINNISVLWIPERCKVATQREWQSPRHWPLLIASGFSAQDCDLTLSLRRYRA